jgi:hypothetical protein
MVLPVHRPHNPCYVTNLAKPYPGAEASVRGKADGQQSSSSSRRWCQYQLQARIVLSPNHQ